MGNSTEGSMLALILALLVVVSIESVAIVRLVKSAAPLLEAINKCEQTLPRNQECRLVYYAKPIDVVK